MQRLFGERVPFTGIIARQNTLSVFNDFCLSLYLSQLKSSTQEYMQSIKEPIIEEKCSYILIHIGFVIHIRLDIGMFVDFCSSIARGWEGEVEGQNPPPTSFHDHWIRLNPRKNGISCRFPIFVKMRPIYRFKELYWRYNLELRRHLCVFMLKKILSFLQFTK